MEAVTYTIEHSIAEEMPKRFGLILDGWSHDSEHFIAVFAWLNRTVAERLGDYSDDLNLIQALMVNLRTLNQSAKLRYLSDLLQPAASKRRLRELLGELKDAESVSKALQGAGVDLLDVRVWFDGLIASKSSYARYLGKKSSDLLYLYGLVARTTFGQQRHSLQPYTLLFLRQNADYWDARIVESAE
ncbi:hypothetical protein BBJ28_00015001 [Nothophytophthora sp. Chile5]|nr:hypothetical protein BBJ28_00015001 [Nothophytophthora sp. Chile5]